MLWNELTNKDEAADGDTAIISSVQGHVEKIVENLRLNAGGDIIQVRRMGSREYGCADATSDLDLYLKIPDSWAGRAKEIRLLLSEALVDSQQAQGGKFAPEDQNRNCTLKWTSTRKGGPDVSLLVAVEKVVNDAVSATYCLTSIFNLDNTKRETVRETLVELRKKGLLNTHGRKASVLQSLKTTPAALLCVALLEHYDPKSSTDSRRVYLLSALSTFNGAEFGVWFDWNHREGAQCYVYRDASPSGNPLRIMRHWKNSAERVTFPQWAKVQYECDKLVRPLGNPLFQSLCPGAYVDCSPPETPWPSKKPRHVRLHIPRTPSWNEDFAVVSIWPGSGEGTLLVASGNSNDAKYNIKGYKYIVAVTWCQDHNSNPLWFPRVLLSVAMSITKPRGERLDVLGFSRGVQAVMCCFDTDTEGIHRLGWLIGHIVLAGGCIWQRGDPLLPRRIINGLHSLGQLWQLRPLSAVVVSEMDATVWMRGDVSKGKRKYRVDYQDFSRQVSECTRRVSVLKFAGHGAVLRHGESIMQALKTSGIPLNDPPHFICGDLEEVLQEAAEAEGTPRLKPGGGGRGCTSADASVEVKGKRCVFNSKLPSCGPLPRHMDKPLQEAMKHPLALEKLLLVVGDTGVGKSRRGPLAALMSQPEAEAKGVLHVLPRKIASYSLLKFYRNSSCRAMKKMASVWNGDGKTPPAQAEFVVLSTPVSAFHKLWDASSWEDLSLIVFDEIQVKDGLVLLLIVYVLTLIRKGDERARGVSMLLMTATPQGAAYSALESALAEMGVKVGSITMSPCESYKQFSRQLLWDVVDKPDHWDKRTQISKVCEALILMTEWLWNHQKQSASIIIFVAGESECLRMRTAISLSKELQKVSWKWHVTALWGGMPVHKENEVHERLDAHVFESTMRALFVVMTAGKGEDGWTPNSNGLINCSEQVNVDDLGFLNKIPSDKVNDKQREGRVGRVTDSLYVHLGESREPSSTLRLPYAERLKVCLAAMALGFNEKIPALSAVDNKEAVSDLVKLQLCTTTCEVTPTGSKCLQGDMEIQSALLVEVGTRLGVGPYARIAAAYIAAGVDLFSNPNPELQQHIGLTDAHLKHASKHGDIHTAVKWYLRWRPQETLPEVQAGIFNMLCFRRMHCYLNGRVDDFVLDDLVFQTRALRLSVAIAFAFQKNIVCRHGNRCVTCFINEDPKRVDGLDTPLDFLNTEVEISNRSVCYSDKESDSNSPSFLVYVKGARFPHILGLTVLPTNIAIWFSHFRVCVENEIDYAAAFGRLLFDRPMSASLSRFISLLDGCDGEVELDIPMDECGVPNGQGASTSSSSSSRAARSSMNSLPSTMPSNSNEPVAGRSGTSGDAARGSGGRGSTSADAERARAATSTTEHHAAERQPAATGSTVQPPSVSTVAATGEDMYASEDMGASHRLIARVREALRVKDDCDVDTGVLVQTLRRIASASPELTEEANSLAERVMGAEAPIHGDTTRKEVVAILKMIMRGRSDIPHLGRKIKTFVYNLHKDALRKLRGQPGESVTFTLEQQEELLQQAIGCGDAGENQQDIISSKIADIPAGRTVNQTLADKANKRINKARQMIAKEPPYGMRWILQEDVIDEVKATGVTDHKEAVRHAQSIWSEVCFPRTLFILGNKEATKAEFISEWLQGGYTWQACIDHLETLWPSSSDPPKRKVPQSFHTESIKKLKAKLATTYTPNAAR